MQKLNIGAGIKKMEGFINIDISPDAKPDLLLDIEDGLPFEDNSTKETYAYNVLEQISSPKKLIFVLNELWRITSKDGFVMVRVPNANFITAWQDPMDCRRFTEETFTYFQGTNTRYHEYGKLYGFKPWTVVKNDCPNAQLLLYCLRPIK